MPDQAFVDRLNEQIGHEFAASQQYPAIAVHYEAETLPRLAAFFYRQALEERNHAMMMVQYLLDADVDAGSRASTRRRTFADVVAPVALALEQEKRVTEPDQRAGRPRPRAGRLHLRAVHAVVHQGAGRGGLLDVRPAARRPAREGQPAAGRGVPRPRDDRDAGEDPTAPEAAGGAL